MVMTNDWFRGTKIIGFLVRKFSNGSDGASCDLRVVAPGDGPPDEVRFMEESEIAESKAQGLPQAGPND